MTTLTTLPKNSFNAVQRAIGSHADAKLNQLFDGKDTVELDRDALAELMLSGADGIGSLFRQGRNGAKTKKIKDPSAPKRATSAYLLWLNENRETIISEHFGEDELTGREKVSKVGKKAGELWKAMNEEDKTPYIEKSKEQQAIYKAAMAEYKPSSVVAVKPDNLDFSELPEAPAEWTGPFNGKKLHKLANGGKMDVGKFYSFEAAVKAAEELGDSCSGITYESKSGKYSLRKTFNWCGDGVEGEDCSWVRGEITVCTPKESKPKEAKKPKKAKKSKKAQVVSVTANPLMEMEVETETFGTPEPKAEKSKKSKKLAVAPEPEPEVVEESEDEDEDEEVSVRRWTHQGKQYLLDDHSGEVYDMETQEVIGQLQEDGSVEFEE
tara:strand:- start:594 stop:1736 length:1143 start_codon:yes stop_codon:yes gene_type:complete